MSPETLSPGAARLLARVEREVARHPQKSGAAALAHIDRRLASVGPGFEREHLLALREATDEAMRRQERCIRCGEALSDPVSVERRIGPICWKRETRHA